MAAIPSVVTAGERSAPVPPDLRRVRGRGSGRVRAFEYGFQAAWLRYTKEHCPYEEGPGSASFRKAWMRGFKAYHDAPVAQEASA